MRSAKPRLMEVCGTHTTVIARAGIKGIVPDVTLLSGPGCPVCVTPSTAIDAYIRLSEYPGVTLACYGDMLRVPGSDGRSLISARTMGADIKIVYSAMDAVQLAEAARREVVFLGVGFETTAPGTAAAIKEAARLGLANFSVFPLLKRVSPALRALLEQPDFRVDGFICPGHVASITGAEEFAFLCEEYNLPAVVTGFEPGDILRAVAILKAQLSAGEAKLINAYARAVKPLGNPLAKQAISDVFSPCASVWRGLGSIPESGLEMRKEYSALDAVKRFSLSIAAAEPPTVCRCADILCGRCTPRECPLFGTCTPEAPVGPCMVSGEGACAAAYKYEV